MNKKQSKLMVWAGTLCLLFVLGIASGLAKPQNSPGGQINSDQTNTNQTNSDQTTSASKKKKKSKEGLANAQPTASPDSLSSTPPGITPASLVSPAPAGKSSKGSSSDQDINSAKASGKVWVNLETGVYHKRGRWYGKTKNGKFMTPDEAKKAGYRPAKRE